MQEKIHPTVGVLVRSNGEVFVPANGKHKAHWTFGWKSGNGYLNVRINGKQYLVHRLVAEAFIGPIPDGYEVDHINRRRDSNFVKNLRITTRSGNSRNTSEHDRVEARGGTHCYENYKQYCKEWDARRRKRYKYVWFSDGKRRHIPTSEALLLLAIPVSQRIYKG